MLTRWTGILLGLSITLGAFAQAGNEQVRTKADALFNEERYAEAMPLYSQLISLDPSDHELSYRYGTTLLFSGTEKERAIGYLKYAVTSPSITPEAWFWLGRAYHLDYQFSKALEAYGDLKAKADKKLLAARPVDALMKQCSNGLRLLSNLKEIEVRNKTEVDKGEFFRFYDLAAIGGKIVVLPEELMSPLDKRSKEPSLIYLPENKGPIYFSSYGKKGETGKDIYRTELLPTGSFAKPIKVAGHVNTDQDEDFPFLHPDGKTFYFSSKGHNSMGGYDVFRAAYDSRNDVFGIPENLDFAINTPDDDLLYVVDADHQEACFASGRSSEQGKLHVYRVSTTQVPLVITVLQGVYTNEFDQNDRKARIVVEDAITREKITEVRTDPEGGFVLALPRSGKYRFLVDCGPSKKTHVGMVDVPRSDQANAYRQELALTDQGGQEKLVIRNFFDKPLGGDLIALALEEIKRRARLDVNERPAVAQEQQEHFDVLTRAGISGGYSQADVQRMAADDARELEKAAIDLLGQKNMAYAMAMDQVEIADSLSVEAKRTLDEAVLIEDEKERHERMMTAAELRDASMDHMVRSRTAFRTAQDLEAEHLAAQQKAIAAQKLVNDISGSLLAGREDEAVEHLKVLKQRLDQKARPDQDPDPVVKAERAMLEKEKQAKSALARAMSAREEEDDLRDRIKELERERNTAKGKRIEEIDRDIASFREDLVHLGKEKEKKFAVVREQEEELFNLRGEYLLKKHLASATPEEDRTIAPGELDALAQRIANTGKRIENMPVDERFLALLASTPEERTARVFDWESPSLADRDRSRGSTGTMPRDRSGEAERIGSRSAAAGRIEPTDPKDVDVADVPAGTEKGSDRKNGIEAQDPIDRNTGTNDHANENLIGQEDLAGVTDETNSDENAQDRNEAPVLTPEQVRDLDDAEVDRMDPNSALDAATRLFLLENELAEIDQLAAAQNDPQKRDSLKQRRDGVEKELKAIEAEAEQQIAQLERIPDERSWEPEDLARVPMVFNRDTKEEDLVNELFSEYFALVERLNGLADRQERAAGLHGLELMLADSLRGEMARQLMVLDLDPQQAERILPRVERLRSIRESHLQQAQAYLEEELLAETDNENSDGSGRDQEITPIDPVRSENEADTAATAQDTRNENDAESTADTSVQVSDQQPVTVRDQDNTFSDQARTEDAADINEQQAVTSDQVPVNENDQNNITTGSDRSESTADLADRNAPTSEATGDRAEERSTTSDPIADPLNDRFVQVYDDPVRIYESPVQHRSIEIAESLQMKENDLERISSLSQRIDSALKELPYVEKRKDQDQMRKQVDRMIDDRLIASVELGQRTAFLTKEEWRTANDSLRVLQKATSGLGLPSNEPVMIMARDMRSEAMKQFDSAAQLRRSADRSQDIFARDSLYRKAYQLELQALRDLDRSITTHNYLLSDAHVRGEQISYEELAAKVLRLEAPLAGAPIDRNDDVAVIDQREATIIDPDQEDPTEADPLVTGEPGTDPEIVTDDAARQIEKAREEAKAFVMEQESTLPDPARRPANVYERMLASDPINSVPEENAVIEDPEKLDKLIVSLREEATALDREAMRLSDRATSIADSARALPSVQKERVMKLALRTHVLSDSLRTASLLKLQEARDHEAQEHRAIRKHKGHRRIVKYYYMDAEDLVLVIGNDDNSRYFQLMTQAQERVDAARAADTSSIAVRNIAATLKQQALQAEQDAANGRLNALVAAERSRYLNERAGLLYARADSLNDVSSRLRSAAQEDRVQADQLLSTLPPAQAELLRSLETGTRRDNITMEVAPESERAADTSPVAERIERTEAPENTDDREVPQEPAVIAESRESRPIPDPVPPTVRADGTISLPKKLVNDIFELHPAGVRKAQPILVDAELPEGIIFKVQIGAFRNPIPGETFSDMSPVMSEDAGNGLTRYTAGLFTSFDHAFAAKDKVRDRGYRDAFVVAYRNGVRIPLGEAMRGTRPADPIADLPQDLIAGTRDRAAADRPGSNGTSTEPVNVDRKEERTNTTRSQGTERQTGSGTESDRTAVTVSEPIEPAQQDATIPIDTATARSTTGTSVFSDRSSIIADRMTPAAPALTVEEENKKILERYPATPEEIVAQFRPASEGYNYYPVTGAAPARPVEMIMGLFFTVQVGVYTKPVELDKLFNITPLVSELTETGKIRYSTGVYTDMDAARERRLGIVETGVKDAFVTAYLNGTRIPVRDAVLLLEEHGAGILAKP